MADLNPLGGEKLQGMNKINRILEIARYNEPSQNINESKADYTIQLADGNYYGIVNEKNGYIVKSLGTLSLHSCLSIRSCFFDCPCQLHASGLGCATELGFL